MMKLKAVEDTLVIELNRHSNSEVSKEKVDMDVREVSSNLKILSLETVVDAKRI